MIFCVPNATIIFPTITPNGGMKMSEEDTKQESKKIWDNAQVQQERHSAKKNEKSATGFKSKQSEAEKTQNKTHTRPLDEVVEKAEKKKMFECPFCGALYQKEESVRRCISINHEDQIIYAFKLFRNSPLINDVNPSLPIFNVLTFKKRKIESSDFSAFEIGDVLAFLNEDKAEKFILKYNQEKAPNYAALYPRDLSK
jgi:hypothetical protein